MRSKYDAVVVGAGPAGAMAAYEIASAGYSILLLEKHKRPGMPLCCAEAVSRAQLESLIEPKEEWISSRIERARVTAPDGCQATVFRKRAGYILERKLFDHALVRRAEEAGAVLECEAIGHDLKKVDGIFRSIIILRPDGSQCLVEARIFIAADGVESQAARRAGINNLFERKEVLSALQYRMEDIEVEDDMIQFFVGSKVAPQGYIWVFPKSPRSANVGVGIAGTERRGAKTAVYLDRFISEHFCSGRIAERYCGMIPRYQGGANFRAGNLLVVGDAARTVDSFSGAGIVNGMLSGKYAGLAAAEYLSGRLGDIDEIERFYPGRFLDEKGEELSLYARLRRAYENFGDADFTDIVLGLREYFSNHSTDGVHVGKLIIGIIRARPRLIRLVRHLI
ncbi:MAG: NAD(P)/FAD-dependent oxidoreductase [Candidatus Zixiibacteriota bacterium]|nr:MAG: NAD(P)/FAD-dependent oxidoreductase [candidate division Zixibacteria bacterium]